MPLPKKQYTKEQALRRFTTLCSKSEQCEFDVMNKMIMKGLPSKERQEVIEYLKENRYLDNSRFARSFTNDKSRFSAWGPFKIKAELYKKHIKSEYITEALKEVDQEVWKEGLLKNARGKAKTLQLTDEDCREEWLKLYRYLLGRGFPSKAVSQVVSLMKKELQEEK